jgi:DNA-binding NtrC family response regulator
LYYRLNVVPILIPPLRERVADIAPLAEHFLAETAAGRMSKQFSAAAIDKLTRHGWPGNVRQLRNVVERAYVMSRGPVIALEDIDVSGDEARAFSAAELARADLPTAVARLEEAMIREALEACGGNRTEAARRLNINRQLLYAKMQRYGIAGSPRPES